MLRVMFRAVIALVMLAAAPALADDRSFRHESPLRSVARGTGQDFPVVELVTMGVGSLIWERHGHIALCVVYENPLDDACYNYGVALINQRNLTEARATLQRGLELAPGADHIHYALALACALGGDPAGAVESLRRAIELEPRNRTIARQDTDFGSVVRHPAFESLLYPEKKGW